MEDFVTFEIAKKLRETGYPMVEIPIGGRDNQNIPVLYDLPKEHPNWQDCKAWWVPTISQVLKWLRKTHKLFLSPCVIADYQDDFSCGMTYWSFIVVNIESGDSIYREYDRVTEKRYETYEAAALAGIEYVLDNLIQL